MREIIIWFLRFNILCFVLWDNKFFKILKNILLPNVSWILRIDVNLEKKIFMRETNHYMDKFQSCSKLHGENLSTKEVAPNLEFCTRPALGPNESFKNKILTVCDSWRDVV